jgi:hypothetical protein
MLNVEWQPSALDDLAAICLDHPHRWNDIDTAANDVDYKLRKNPTHFSQPVAEELRRILSHPLAVYFSIAENQITVEAIGWLE